MVELIWLAPDIPAQSWLFHVFVPSNVTKGTDGQELVYHDIPSVQLCNYDLYLKLQAEIYQDE